MRQRQGLTSRDIQRVNQSAAGIAAAFAVLAGAGVANASPTPSPSGSSSERVEVSLAAVDETPALHQRFLPVQTREARHHEPHQCLSVGQGHCGRLQEPRRRRPRTFGVIHKMTLNAGKRDWSESIQVTKANITGDAHGIKMSLAAKKSFQLA